MQNLHEFVQTAGIVLRARPQRDMAAVFDPTPENILMHLRNVFSSGELDAEATTEDSSVVRTEGRRRVRRSIRHYNPDAIISVGYRVNSQRGVRFRRLRGTRCGSD